MELKLISELWGIHGYFVKEISTEGKKIILRVERENYSECPMCGQLFFAGVKDSRMQTVEDVPAFGKRCYIQFYKCRIECACGYCGTEKIDWLDKYDRATNRYREMIYQFCKRMTGVDVGRLFGISKNTVYRLDKKEIKSELENQAPINSTKISIDEISRKKGHRYATIISDPDNKKVLEVIKGRKAVDLTPFFKGKGKKWCENIQAVTMDAWLAFRKAVRDHCINAVICFDHFHLAQHFSKAIDKLRVTETKKADDKEKQIYKGTRWLLLKRPENLKEDQKLALDTLLEVNKNLYKAYILRDEFRQIFEGISSHSRLIRLTNWIKQAKAARINHITEFVKKIEKWEPFIRNSLRNKYSNSFAEGINVKIRVIQRMAYGYKDFEYLRLKIIQQFNFRDIRSIYDG